MEGNIGEEESMIIHIYVCVCVCETYLRSPSTSGRSLVMAITRANKVTKVVMKATGELQVKFD